MRRSPFSVAMAAPLAVALTLAACDIGDGTTLQDPVAPTTTAPPDTTPLPSVPIDDDARDSTLEPTPIVDSVPVGNDDPVADVSAFRVIAPWPDGATIDPGFTCDGAGQAPVVSWTDVPDGTAELALSLVDESNLSDGVAFVHWVVAGIDPAAGQVIPGELPPGAFEAINFSGAVGYSAPCPDPGSTAVLVLRLFAVGQQVESGLETPAEDVLEVIESVSFAFAATSGTFTR